MRFQENAMNKTILAIVLFFVVIPTTFASTEYVIANGNDLNSNRLFVYELDTTVGTLHQVAILETGGDGLGTVFPTYNFSVSQQAVSTNATCVFALDARSEDIASFSKSTNYGLVGRYADSSLNPTLGGSLALTPDGKFLYATYISSQNIGAWAVNSDCSLSLIASYLPDDLSGLGSLKVTPNGSSLIVCIAGATVSAEMYSINSSSGALTDLGVLGGFCGENETSCLPQGLDITKDGRFAIFAIPVQGAGSFPYAAIAHITSQGLANPSFWSLKNSSLLPYPASVFLSASAFAGSGDLFFGMSGNGRPNGVVTTTFNENPLSISVTNSTVISPPQEAGNIAITGQWAVIAEYPSQIGVFLINPDGSLTEVSTTMLNAEPGIISLTVFPVTR